MFTGIVCWGKALLAGLLCRALWHASPAGVCVAASDKPKRPSSKRLVCHEPETISQRAWLRTWQEARKSGSKSTACLHLIEVFLSSMSNSGTVDRFLGLCKLTQLRRGHVDQGGLEAALKVLTQDLGGRRREPLNPKQLLTEAVPRQASAGGGQVRSPASQYCLQSMRLYKLWYGERNCAGRSLEPCANVIGTLKASKPRLSSLRASNPKAEGQQLKQHAASVKAAVEKVNEGGGGVGSGPLGPIHFPKEAPHALSAQSKACWDMAQRKRPGDVKEGDAKRQRSSAAEVCTDTIDKQRHVLKQKEAAKLRERPNEPTPYVDAKGGLMRPEVPPSRQKPKPPPAWPQEPRLHRADDCKRPVPLNLGLRRVLGDEVPDLYLVRNVLESWESPTGLYARIAGGRLVDHTWLDSLAGKGEKGAGTCFYFSSFMRKHRIVLFLTAAFCRQHLDHMRILEHCCSISPTLKVGKSDRKRLEVTTDKMPEKLEFPTKSFRLVGDEPSHADEKPSLTLPALLLKCARLHVG